MIENRNDRVDNKNHFGKDEFEIVNLLPRGKENAISTSELVNLLGCGSTRELQQIIARERCAGAIICSGSKKGYWLPKDRKEVEDFCKTMDKRAKNIFNATKSAKRYLELPEGQQELY